MQVKIEKLVYGGDGLAHDGDSTLFVPFVLPGEEIEVEITERKKKLVRGRVSRLLKSATDRVEPPCPHFGVCGGCNYQHISYEAQLTYKEQILRETLRRIGRIDWTGPIAIHRSPPWEYRNRAQWTVRANEARPSRQNANTASIGYFRPHSSELCPVRTCLIISPRLLSVFQALRDAFSTGALSDVIRGIEAFTDASDAEVILNVACASFPRAPEALLQKIQQIVPSAKSILLQDSAGSRMSLLGPGFLNYEVSQKKSRVGHLSFFQVNRFLIEEMAKTVCNLAGHGEIAFDLYAGVGLFAAFLSNNFTETIAIEDNAAAARDLETVAAVEHHSITVHNKPAGSFLADWHRKRSARVPDVIVADPPRAGLETEAVHQITAVASRKLVYVSCDPSTLARDLAKLCSSAYTLRELHLFDMFPQTYHIESVAFLERTR